LPKTTPLHREAWSGDDSPAQITLRISSLQAAPRGPGCHAPARHVHRRYTRTLAELPWSGDRGTWQLRVRTFCCRKATCARRISTERRPGVAHPWARRTLRLAACLRASGWALGGAAGVRLSRHFGLTVSRHTWLRVIRRIPDPVVSSPQVLSVDDVALRTRHTYGTLRLDLARRRPLALLPDRDATTVARWLQGHPGVEVVVRDRGEAYADAARLGAPTAGQVADRVQLRQQLADTLPQVFTAQASQLARVHPPRAAPAPVHDPAALAAVPQPSSGPLAPPQSSTAAARLARPRRPRRWAP
jgi:transposase